eukprot:CAMPEP_0204367484 /NCGR_PEP_ID=MMETSP0469-20131031/43460_1 /ASSEMBLY_ACC=CAM_ASM_000384 /TAXON_ID=2969 /ORGANISM="Oxyrrhis marina" /LENGTH=98 /DNA_ID=CAMNT_0051356887 /DNA_START=228 /DNA_END=522 /DNA_ORIENTATION=-
MAVQRSGDIPNRSAIHHSPDLLAPLRGAAQRLTRGKIDAACGAADGPGAESCSSAAKNKGIAAWSSPLGRYLLATPSHISGEARIKDNGIWSSTSSRA